ncbi:DNA primase [Actinoplanes sp. ATCC 53533]|uniref:DNA primase n=1 Tax=Actinoplanes sp. ATCC 53533 TaxID=1288362 RepID=UPI000F779C2E|nr:DNA primase [Actinoplanes sp. ATCC 53533]RSM65215.1 DNA primase [Actinoplanes sp. ATCC 53533]
MTSQSPEEGSTVKEEKAVVKGELSGRDLWDEVRISPVEIAMPGGVGLTLRAYRLASELTPTEIEVDEDDPFDARERAAAARAAEEEGVIVDDEFTALVAEGDAGSKSAAGRSDGKSDGTVTTEDGEVVAEPDAADFADEPEEVEEKEVDEEVPMFLSHRGKLLTFKTPESLVSFIRSGAPHDLAQLDSWPTLAEQVQSTDIDPAPDDRYELDLVVENLRGGHDTWDLPLLIAAGEAARDLGHALRLKPVILALAPGSPLDDLDESLRSAESGGMGGFFGRRKLRKIGAQQASLGWRSIIGKISAAVDWRD